MAKFSLGKDKPKKKKKSAKKTKAKKAAPSASDSRKRKKKGRDLAERAASVEFVLPTTEWAEKRIEEEGTGFWTPQKGRNRILMLPSVDPGRLSPWVETRGHYLGGQDVLKILGLSERPEELPLVQGCLRFHNDTACGNCKLEKSLKKSRRKAERDLGSSLFANLQCFGNIVDLKSKATLKKGPQPYRFGWTVEKALLGALEDGEIFCDPRDLKVITIRKEGEGRSTKYTVRVTSKSVASMLDISAKKMKRLLETWKEQLHDLDQYMHPIPSPEEIKDAHDVLLGSVQASASDTSFEDDDADDDDIPF